MIKNLRLHYEDYYESEDSEWRRLGALDKAGNIISLCGGLALDSILEIGAGDGSVLQRLSDLSIWKRLYALEISSSGVSAILKRGIPRLIECKKFDGYRIPYDDNKFDLAILTHVLEHVEHPRLLLYEAMRVAKYVIVEVPLEDHIRMSKDFIFSKVGHINFYSQKTIRRLLQSCGLKILRQIVNNPSKATYEYQYGFRGKINYYIKELLIRFLPKIASIFLVYHCSLICESQKSKTAIPSTN